MGKWVGRKSGSGFQPKKFKTTEVESLMRFFTRELLFLSSIPEIVVFQLATIVFYSYHIHISLSYKEEDCALSKTITKKAVILILFSLSR